ncbi:MAG: hypothetical protein PQJ59_06910 [Spirochaetales bacterium]|nr:hypothetical protein [Spirochaetales bacterium]
MNGKRVLILGAITVLTIGRVLAVGDVLKIDFLLREGLEENYSEIEMLSIRLDDDSRQELYREYRKEPLAPLIINFLPFGPGSFIQGDRESAGRIARRGLYATGCAVGMIWGGVEAFDGGSEIFYLGFLVAFNTLWVYNRYDSFISPFRYARKYNSLLGEALAIDDLIIGNPRREADAAPISFSQRNDVISLALSTPFSFDSTRFSYREQYTDIEMHNNIHNDFYEVSLLLTYTRISQKGFTLVIPLSASYGEGLMNGWGGEDPSGVDEYPITGSHLKGDILLGYSMGLDKRHYFTFALGQGVLYEYFEAENIYYPLRLYGSYHCITGLVSYKLQTRTSWNWEFSFLASMGWSDSMVLDSPTYGKLSGKGTIVYLHPSVGLCYAF